MWFCFHWWFQNVSKYLVTVGVWTVSWRSQETSIQNNGDTGLPVRSLCDDWWRWTFSFSTGIELCMLSDPWKVTMSLSKKKKKTRRKNNHILWSMSQPDKILFDHTYIESSTVHMYTYLNQNCIFNAPYLNDKSHCLLKLKHIILSTPCMSKNF